jgi:hypothetical protein
MVNLRVHFIGKDKYKAMEETIQPSLSAEIVKTDTITVEKAKLMLLIQQKKDLQQVFNISVELLCLLQNLFGGNIPKDMVGMLRTIPKIIKSVKNNPELIERVAAKIEVIKTLAPQYMSEELKGIFVENFKKLDDGNNE